MSKVIKVEGKIYDELDRLRGRRQTFSQVIEELLIARERLVELYQGLQPQSLYRDQAHEAPAPLHDASPETKP